jgi:hypothetical protein
MSADGAAPPDISSMRTALDRLLDLPDDDRRWLFDRLSPPVRARLYAALHDRALEEPPPMAHLGALPAVLRGEPDWLVRCVLRALDPADRRRLQAAASRTDRARWDRLESDPWSPGGPLQSTAWRLLEQRLGGMTVEELEALDAGLSPDEVRPGARSIWADARGFALGLWSRASRWRAGLVGSEGDAVRS